MIKLIKAKQRMGKTTVAVGIAWEYVRRYGYNTSEIYSNIRLYQPDGTELKEYHLLTNPQMRLFVRRMITDKIRHVILIIDEIDSVFSHLFWQKQEQAETLLGLWKDEKLFIVVIGTCHVGKSVDLIIRQSLAEIIVVNIDKFNDWVNMVVINTVDREVKKRKMYHASFIQELFDSWEVASDKVAS